MKKTVRNKETAVRCQDVIKTYGEGSNQVIALRGVNLEVKPGELMLLVGPSGCGKTTLISVIVGILDQDQGVCEVYSQDLFHMQEREKLRYRARNIGFVFQQFNLFPTLTVAENVAIPLIVNGVSRQEATARAKEILDQMGLKDKVDVLPIELSGGQQQRVAIARAIVHDPKLVVCDEPTSSLDGETGRKVMNLLKTLAMRNDRTLIVVTHDSRIFDFADRIAHMEDGRITKIVHP